MDRAAETLKRRIAQLENDLHVATTKNDELERTMVALRAEAHDVVGQWEKEAYDVRRKLDASEVRGAELERELRNQKSTASDLQIEAASSQKVIAEYSASIKELQEKLAQTAKEQEETLRRACAAEELSVTLTARVEKYEALTTKIQAELTVVVDEKQRDMRELDTLRQSLDEMTEEARFVRREKEELAANAEKLLLRTHELKQQNEMLRGDGGALSDQVGALQEEVDTLRPRADAACELEAALHDAREREQTQAAVVETLQKEVDTLNNISQDQMSTITTLEADIQEFRDSEENYKRAVKELEAMLDSITQAKEDIEKELAVVRENYSAVLIELSEVKASSEVATEKLERQLSDLTEHHNRISSEWQQESERAASLIHQLHTDIYEHQLRDLVRLEIIERSELTEAQERETAHLQNVVLRVVVEQCAMLTSRTHSLSAQNEEIQADLVRISSASDELKAKLSAAEHSEAELRKANGILESKVQKLDSKLQATESSNGTLTQDNQILKDQVEAMRMELGELDEIVNANLTEMRENNESLMAKNAVLEDELRSIKEAGETTTRQAAELERQIGVLENEHAAQTTTLQLAEDELRKNKDTMKKQDQSLLASQEALRYAQERVDELERDNRRINADASILRDSVSTLETKMKFIVADKRQEMDALRIKLNSYVEKAETNDLRAQTSDERRKEAEAAASAAKESQLRMRAALDELKDRCSRDTESIKQLLLERDDSIKERDLIVEKYNRLHDAFHNVRKEVAGKAADEVQRLLGLCEKQEDELQQLRKQNTILKKSVSMFVSTPPPKAEAVFMEHLNLAEGPLRHPKKRALVNPTE